MTSILEKRFDFLKAKALAKTRGQMIVRRIIDGDTEAELDRMVAAGEVKEADAERVLIINRVVIDPEPSEAA
jgi:hypothetical protein